MRDTPEYQLVGEFRILGVEFEKVDYPFGGRETARADEAERMEARLMLSNNRVMETDILGQIGYLGDDISPSGETSRRPQ